MPDLFGWYTPPTQSSGDPFLNPHTGQPVAFRRFGQDERPYVELSNLEPMLRQAGLWDTFRGTSVAPERSWLVNSDLDRGSRAQSRSDYETWMRGLNWGALDGWGLGDSRQDYYVTHHLRAPDGTIYSGDPIYDRQSWNGDDWANLAQNAALIYGGGAMFGNAMAGAGLGAGSALPELAPMAVPDAAWASLPSAELASSTATLGATAGTSAGTALPAGATAGTGLQTINVTAPAWGSGIGTLPATIGESLGAVASLPTNAAAGITPFASAGSSLSWDSVLGKLANGGARSIVDLASGLYGLSLASDARKASDPFAQYRGAYGAQLAALEANPSTITSRPGWRAGLEGVDRQMAARGYYGSGNMDAARTRYAGDFYTQEANRLATLAGAGQSPGAGQFNAAQLASQSLASIGYGLAPWIGGRPS